MASRLDVADMARLPSGSIAKLADSARFPYPEQTHEASDLSPGGGLPDAGPAARGGRPRDLVGASGRAARHGAGAALPRPLPHRGGGSRGRDVPRGPPRARGLGRSRLGRSAEILRAGAPGPGILSPV